MGTLFEPARKNWVFLEKARDLGSGDISDEEGAKLGYLHRVTAATGGLIEFKELDGTIACVIRKKNGPIEYIYEVKDAKEKFLGRIRETIRSSIKRSFRLEIEEKKKLLEAKGKAFDCIYVIIDGSGNEVARVTNFNMRKEIVKTGAITFKKKFSLRINDAYVGKVDARQLVGFVIAIEDISRD